MAGVVQFREKGRKNLAKTLAIVHWICILPSFICLLSALHIQLAIEDKIFFIEDYNGAILPGVLVFTGFFGLFTHVLSGKVTFSVRRVDKRKKWAIFLLPVVLVTFIIFLSEMVSGIMCFVHVADLGQSFDAGIRTAMAAYKNDVSTKGQMDVLQMSYDCCGSKGYRDWFYMSWIHPDYISESKQQQRHSDFGENFLYDDVPFSCCNPGVLRPCIHHHVLDNDLHYNYDHRTKTTLHTTGCTDRLKAFYENSVLTVIGTIVLSLSFVQLFTTVGCRYLQTAIQGAMDSDDPQGPSMGYLFMCGKKHKKDVDDTLTTADTVNPDTTAETGCAYDDSFDDDDVEEERYPDIFHEDQPLYLNVPPRRQQAYDYTSEDPSHPHEDEEEHIYHEGEVEDYLARRYATSREKFEIPSGTPSMIEEEEDENEFPTPPKDLIENEDEPVYENLGPNANNSTFRPSLLSTKTGSRSSFIKSLGSVIHQSNSRLGARSKTGLSQSQVQANHGRFMNISNSSLHVRKSRKKPPPAYRHRSPSTSSQDDSSPYVINMKSYKSANSLTSPVRYSRLLSPTRQQGDHGSIPYVINMQRHRSAPSLPLYRRELSPIRSPVRHTHGKANRRGSFITVESPKKRFRRASGLVPYIYNVMAKSKRRDSPERQRYPENRYLAETVEFKSGVSYGCNHALE